MFNILALGFTLEILISEEWDNQLTDTSSEKFKELANRMEQQVCCCPEGDIALLYRIMVLKLLNL